jgi:effector-binding domain-containing protein
MIEKPWIARCPEQHVAIIRLRVPALEMQTVMGPGISEVFAAVSSQGITPAGPWFNHHFEQPTDVFDFAICVPVPRPIHPVGRVRPDLRLACSVVRTNYTGPYERLGDAWGDFMIEVELAEHDVADDFWEAYTIGPDVESDSERFVTELNRPLRD